MVAALAVIGQKGDILRGALALFAMAIGMGSPLLVVGAGGGRFLPHAGPWMTTIKALFGVLFLGVAVWMLARVLPGTLTLALWALLVDRGGLLLRRLRPREPGRRCRAARRARLRTCGHRLGSPHAGRRGGRRARPVAAAARRLACPGSPPRPAAASESALPFRKIASVEDLDRELAAAKAAGKPAMLDFYADWCVSCKEMEKYTFSVPEVQKDLAGFVLLKADVTANNEARPGAVPRFGVYGPPTTAFFGAHGGECRAFRLVGFVKADAFRSHLARFAREC